jgi:hypothetical protein
VTDIEISSDNTGEQLMEKLTEKEGYPMDHLVRLVYNGKPINREITLKENNVLLDSTLFIVYQERIGEFGIGNLPGAQILEFLEHDYKPTPEEVSQLIKDVYSLHGLKARESDLCQVSDDLPFELIPDLLSCSSREAIISNINNKHNGETDLKFKLTSEELISIIGLPDFERMRDTYGASIDEIWLRRAQVDGMEHQGINWHVDHSTRTMQIALNGDNEYEGGKLVFAHNGKILAPRRLPGTATIHDHKVVHGVTPLKNGPRFGLYFLHIPTAER